MRLGGLLGWRREPDEPMPAAQPLQVLRADGQRIDLGARDAGQRLVATRTGQDWQEDAWSYRDMIGELRYAHRLLARQVAKCRFYAAEIRPGAEDPIDLASTDHKMDARLAGDAVANLARLPLDDDPDGFLATLSENLSTAGESWIHGEPDGVQERWTVRSVSEIVSAGDVIMLSELPNTTMARRQIVPPQELLRCWIRHPRWGQLADSPLRAMLDDPLEEIILTGREMRAAARSRIAANGVLLIPAELSLLKDRQTEEDPTAVLASADTFMRDLEAAFTAPIRNEGDPGSVVPIVFRGQAEHLKEVRHLVLQRADHEKLAERKAAAVLRMLKSLDVQPEQVEGLGGLNHWSAWVLEAKDIKQQVDPMASVLAGCLTKAMLRPALLSQHHRPDQVRRVAVLADSSGLAENPNRGQDARDAHDRLVISDETLRRALGFDDEDAPDEEEVQRRIAAKAGIDQGTSAVVLDLLKALQESQQSKPAPMVVDAQPATRELPSSRNGAQPAGPGERVPEKPTPDEPTRMVAAAVPELDPTDGWRVDVDAARELAAIDAALVDRIVTAADAAIARMLERAGNRLRTVARRDRELVASLESLEPHLVAAVVGREKVETYTTTSDLLSDTYVRLRGQIRSWLTDAARQVGRVVLRILGLERRSTEGRRVHDLVVSRLETRHDTTVDAVLDAVRTAAEAALYRADPFAPSDERGEGVTTLLDPGAVTRALAVAGGDQSDSGGMGTGPVVAEVLTGERAIQLGWEWLYHPGVARNTFPPHLDLDGVRVKTMTDPKLDAAPEHRSWLGGFYHPQDHKGCFVAGTAVSGPPAVGSFVRPYVGEGVEMRTDTGKLLTGTPNHPILTPDGWVPLGELREGDQVVITSGQQESLKVDNETHQMPALIEDVAAAMPMASSMVTRPVPTATEDFHGDGAGSDGQITVVRTDSRLLLDEQTSLPEFGGYEVLQWRSEGVSALPTLSVLDPLFPGKRFSSHGGVSGSSDGLPLLERASLVPSAQGGTVTAGGNAMIYQDPADGGTRHTMLTGESEFAGAFDIATDEIVSVIRIPLSCHVYNLTTLTGWYVANGVIVHNCRCSTVSLWAAPEPGPGFKRLDPAQIDPSIRALAESDDAAGRRGTTAQNVREVRDRLAAVYIDGSG